ncbi:MAG: IS3 family transposase [Akkermansiaceae bacterium]
MITPNHPKLSVRRQSKLLNVNRNRLKKPPDKRTRSDTELVRLIDAIYMECPFFGQRQLRNELQKLGHRVGRSRIRRLMKIMGIEALCPKPSTSTHSPAHKKYTYLLRNIKVTEVYEVWCTDITYIPMPQGHCYLVAIMDWHSRAVLAWEVSNTMDTGFCLRALQRAFERTGRKPKVFNTDQGSQFTSPEWIQTIEGNGIKVSMDGKGRWMDNVFIERLWRSVKYEKLRLWSYETVGEVTQLVSDWMEFYSHRRNHSAHGGQSPWAVYEPEITLKTAA